MSYPTIFGVTLREFKDVLEQFEIPYAIDGEWLYSGAIDYDKNWLLFISTIPTNTVEMLHEVLPVIKAMNLPFVLIKDEYYNYRLNAGKLEGHEVGKVFTIFSTSTFQMDEILSSIVPITEKFSGPIMFDFTRVGRVAYLTYGSIVNPPANAPNDFLVHFSTYNEKLYPGVWNWTYKPTKEKKIISDKYVIQEVIKSEARGSIVRAVMTSGEQCIVKTGNPYAVSDAHGRNIRDRLLWQQKVILELQNEIATSDLIEFFEEDDFSYLVLKYVEGELFSTRIRNILNKKSWRVLSVTAKRMILEYYLLVVKLIAKMHGLGYAHRDITDVNFIISPDNKMYVLDFELSYNLTLKSPSPPFLTGTWGYVSPEQLRFSMPTVKEDIYSLGSLLSFSVTGIPPLEFLTDDNELNRSKLIEHTGDTNVTNLIIALRSNEPDQRPDINLLLQCISQFINELQHGK